MKRIVVVSSFALLTAVAWPLSGGLRAAEEPEVCASMTPAKMLEHPGLAEEYAKALLSGRPGEVSRVEALLRDIRAAHGCGGEVALPQRPAGAPLPPGHPPVPSAPGAPFPLGAVPFEAPATWAI